MGLKKDTLKNVKKFWFKLVDVIFHQMHHNWCKHKSKNFFILKKKSFLFSLRKTLSYNKTFISRFIWHWDIEIRLKSSWHYIIKMTFHFIQIISSQKPFSISFITSLSVSIDGFLIVMNNLTKN